jgi:hypothetical protein
VSGIFISYRHEDSADQARRLWDRLASAFGAERVFIDAVSLEPGQDFAQSIREKVAFCDVLIAVIGPGWLDSVTPEGRRRLDDPEDWVRIEITAALDERVPVIPALVGGAVLPDAGRLPTALAALVRSQAIELRPPHFDTDVERLRTTLARRVTGGDVAASWLALLTRRHRALDPLMLERPEMLWRAFGFLVLMMLIHEALKLPAVMSAGLESQRIGFIAAQIFTNSVAWLSLGAALHLGMRAFGGRASLRRSLVVVCFLSGWLPLISLSQAPVWGLHISVTRDMASAGWDPAVAAERMVRFVRELGRFGTVRLLLSFALATALWVILLASLFTALRTLHGLARARALAGLGLGLSAEALFLGFLYAPVTGAVYAAFGLGTRP